MGDDRISYRENEQHLHGRKTHLALAADVVTDEVTSAKQQLPHAVQDRTRTRSQAPHVHHALAHALPPDAPKACPLRACRAIVACEGEPAVVAAVLHLTLDVSHRLTLPTPETRVLLFQRMPVHPYLIVNQYRFSSESATKV